MQLMDAHLLKELSPPFLVHSDLFGALDVVRNRIQTSNKQEILDQHLNFLIDTFGKESLILPSYNYDFPKTKQFDLKNTPSQLGQLSQHCLTHGLFGRTKTPIFNFLTDIKDLLSEIITEPFGKSSVFDFIYNNNGTVLFYGASIISCTYLHFVESQFGPPLFRYDKTFSGDLVDGIEIVPIHVNFHVRPLGAVLEYDADKMYQSLESRGAIRFLYKRRVFAVKAKDLSEIWGGALTSNPYFLLKQSNQVRMKQLCELLGRRVVLRDFE